MWGPLIVLYCDRRFSAPNDTRPSAGTVFTEKLDIFTLSFYGYQLVRIIFLDWIISFNMANEIMQNIAAFQV